MMHAFAGLMVAAAASASSFWGVLTHPIMPRATSTPPYMMASTTRPGFATSSMPMHPPFMRATTTEPGDGPYWNASSSLEHMPRPIPAVLERRFASSTASTTWNMSSTTRPHPMPLASTTEPRATTTPHLPPKHIEGSASATAPMPASGGFWQRLFRFF